MKYRFLEDIAIADVAFEAFGKTAGELFENAALALFEVMADTKKLKAKEKLKVELGPKSLEGLLYSWLSELVFLKDTRETVFKKASVKITGKNGEFFLSAQVSGQKISELSGKEIAATDVKAITKHLFSLKKEKGKFKALVVPDI
ncbi:MAG: archease [Candidatus Diapherotrites archaeon]|nr:archease [Candidatus Diapherotrites archaeon]